MSENIEGGTYGEVITSEVADSLFTPDEGEQQTAEPVSQPDSEVTTDEPVETQATEQPESSEETVPTEEGQPDQVQMNEFEVDGKTYTAEQITEALNDSQNKGEWQRSNTQKGARAL